MTMKTKLLGHFQKPCLMVFLLALSLFSSSSFAHDFEVDGIYYLKNGSEATVTFKGTNCDSYFNEYSENVIIPSTVYYNGFTYSVTSIGYDAFRGCGVTSVAITITEIVHPITQKAKRSGANHWANPVL